MALVEISGKVVELGLPKKRDEKYFQEIVIQQNRNIYQVINYQEEQDGCLGLDSRGKNLVLECYLNSRKYLRGQNNPVRYGMQLVLRQVLSKN